MMVDVSVYRILVAKPNGKRPFGKLTRIDRRQILKSIQGYRDENCGLDSSSSG
jgi:hypothetical protein